MPMSPSEVTNAFAKIYNMTNEALTSSLLDNAWKTMKAASSNTKEPPQSGLLQVEKDEHQKSQHDSEDHKKGETTSRQEDGEKAKADTDVSKPAKLVDPWGGGGTDPFDPKAHERLTAERAPNKTSNELFVKAVKDFFTEPQIQWMVKNNYLDHYYRWHPMFMAPPQKGLWEFIYTLEPNNDMMFQLKFHVMSVYCAVFAIPECPFIPGDGQDPYKKGSAVRAALMAGHGNPMQSDMYYDYLIRWVKLMKNSHKPPPMYDPGSVAHLLPHLAMATRFQRDHTLKV